MKVTVRDHSMIPLPWIDDEIEVVPGRPVPDGRVCFVRYVKKENSGWYSSYIRTE